MAAPVPHKDEASTVLVLGYLALPFDLIPDFLPDILAQTVASNSKSVFLV